MGTSSKEAKKRYLVLCHLAVEHLFPLFFEVVVIHVRLPSLCWQSWRVQFEGELWYLHVAVALSLALFVAIAINLAVVAVVFFVAIAIVYSGLNTGLNHLDQFWQSPKNRVLSVLSSYLGVIYDTQWVTAKIKSKFRPPKFRLYLDQI